jgi:hypothetical protein
MPTIMTLGVAAEDEIDDFEATVAPITNRPFFCILLLSPEKLGF